MRWCVPQSGVRRRGVGGLSSRCGHVALRASTFTLGPTTNGASNSSPGGQHSSPAQQLRSKSFVRRAYCGRGSPWRSASVFGKADSPALTEASCRAPNPGRVFCK